MSIKILANDGIAIEGKQMLEAAGYFVKVERITKNVTTEPQRHGEIEI